MQCAISRSFLRFLGCRGDEGADVFLYTHTRGWGYKSLVTLGTSAPWFFLNKVDIVLNSATVATVNI